MSPRYFQLASLAPSPEADARGARRLAAPCTLPARLAFENCFSNIPLTESCVCVLLRNASSEAAVGTSSPTSARMNC